MLLCCAVSDDGVLLIGFATLTTTNNSINHNTDRNIEDHTHFGLQYFGSQNIGRGVHRQDSPDAALCYIIVWYTLCYHIT